MCECDLDVSPDTDLVQNGNPDAMALFNPNGNFIDAFSYEGSVVNTDYKEGTGSALADSNSTAFVSLSRVADGNDNNANSVDFQLVCMSPGIANFSSASGCADTCLFTATPTPTNTFTSTPTPTPTNTPTNTPPTLLKSNIPADSATKRQIPPVAPKA